MFMDQLYVGLEIALLEYLGMDGRNVIIVSCQILFFCAFASVSFGKKTWSQNEKILNWIIIESSP